jgi:hypothetical protein
VTRCLKEGIVEPEDTSIARRRLGKHVPAATKTQATIEVLLGYNNGNGFFYVGDVDVFKEESFEFRGGITGRDF